MVPQLHTARARPCNAPCEWFAKIPVERVWLKNRTPTKALGGQTPYEVAFGKKPDLCSLREWGSDAYVRFEKSNKLSGCVKRVRWVGINMECETVVPPLIPNLGTNR